VFLPSKFALVAAIAIAWNPTAPVGIPHGFLTGNDYLQEPDTQRQGYVEGLVDGLFMSPAFGADEAVVLRFKACTQPMKSPQIKAIFEKYLRDNPQIWHDDAQVLFWQAMIQACPGLMPR